MILTIIYLGVANGMISGCIAKSYFFEWFRDLVSWFSYPLHKLISCPYCLSHWVAVIMVWLWVPKLTNCGVAFFDYVVAAFVMVAVASISWGAAFYLMDRAEKE